MAEILGFVGAVAASELCHLLCSTVLCAEFLLRLGERYACVDENRTEDRVAEDLVDEDERMARRQHCDTDWEEKDIFEFSDRKNTVSLGVDGL